MAPVVCVFLGYESGSPSWSADVRHTIVHADGGPSREAGVAATTSQVFQKALNSGMMLRSYRASEFLKQALVCAHRSAWMYSSSGALPAFPFS